MVNARRVFATAGVLGKALRGRRGAREFGVREERRGVGARLMLPVLSIANVAGSKQRRQRGMRGGGGSDGEEEREGGRERGKNSSPFCV